MTKFSFCVVSNIDFDLNPIAPIITYLFTSCTYRKEPSKDLGKRIFKPFLQYFPFLLRPFTLGDVLSNAQNPYNLTAFIQSWS